MVGDQCILMVPTGSQFCTSTWPESFHTWGGGMCFILHIPGLYNVKFDRIYFSVNWLETLGSWLFPDWTLCTLGNGELWSELSLMEHELRSPSICCQAHSYIWFDLKLRLRCGWVMMQLLLWHTWDVECLVSSLEWRPKASFCFFLSSCPKEPGYWLASYISRAGRWIL